MSFLHDLAAAARAKGRPLLRDEISEVHANHQPPAPRATVTPAAELTVTDYEAELEKLTREFWFADYPRYCRAWDDLRRRASRSSWWPRYGLPQ